MSNIRELVVNIVADVLGVPSEKITDATSLTSNQCDQIAPFVSLQIGRTFRIDNLRESTVGDLIAIASE